MPGIGDKLMTASEIKEVTDTKLDKDFSSLDTSGGFSLSDTIPVNISGTTYKITGQTLSNAIGGGGGTQQASLTNYVKNCGTISVLPVTLTDSNITSDMIVIEYTIGDETALGSEWTVTTADGSLTISGTLNKSTTLQLVLSVGYSTTPSILTDLASDTADNVLKASPRPGVTGVLPLLHGGVGSSTASGARTNLSVYSKAETDSAIQQSTADKAQKIFFNVATWADVYSKVSSLGAGETAPMLVGTAVVSMMTGGAVPSSVLTGFVGATNLNAGRYTFFATHYSCDFSCMWEINGLTSASATPTVINFSKISASITVLSSDIIASSTYVDSTASMEKFGYRQGNVVAFHFTFKAKAASVSGQTIFSGLPKPYNNVPFQFTALNVTSQKAVEFAVSANGNVAYWYSSNGFVVGDQIRGSVTYICA